MGLTLWVPSPEKAFGAELCPKVPFSVTTAATNARACGPPMCPLWFLPLSKLAPQIEHVTLGTLCFQRSTESPAVTQSAGSFHDLFVAKATSGSQVLRPVRGATEDSRPRDEHVSADLSRCCHARSARHLCRRSASGSALTTRFSTRWARLSLRKRSARWAPSFCPLVRHLFGTTRSRLVRLKDDKESRCSHRRTLALNGARERLRHAIGSRVTLHCQGTAVPCRDSQPWLFHWGLCWQTEQVRRYLVSFPGILRNTDCYVFPKPESLWCHG